MTATTDERAAGFATKACAECGWRFFTLPGLHDHSRNCPPAAPKYWLSDEGRQVMREVGLRNGAIRRRCAECQMETNAPALGRHQKFTGHTGWTEG